jgi:hypothetical protein
MRAVEREILVDWRFKEKSRAMARDWIVKASCRLDQNR